MGFGHFGPGGCCCTLCEGFTDYDESWTEDWAGASLPAEWKYFATTGSPTITYSGSLLYTHTIGTRQHGAIWVRPFQKTNETIDLIRFGTTIIKAHDFIFGDIISPEPAHKNSMRMRVHVADWDTWTPTNQGVTVCTFGYDINVGFGGSPNSSFAQAVTNNPASPLLLTGGTISDGDDIEVQWTPGASSHTFELFKNGSSVDSDTFTPPAAFELLPFGCGLVLTVAHTLTDCIDLTSSLEVELDDTFAEIVSS